MACLARCNGLRYKLHLTCNAALRCWLAKSLRRPCKLFWIAIASSSLRRTTRTRYIGWPHDLRLLCFFDAGFSTRNDGTSRMAPHFRTHNSPQIRTQTFLIYLTQLRTHDSPQIRTHRLHSSLNSPCYPKLKCAHMIRLICAHTN